MKPVIGITVNYNYSDHVGRTCGLGILGQDFNYVAGDYVASFIVSRYVDGKNWLQNALAKKQAAETVEEETTAER